MSSSDDNISAWRCCYWCFKYFTQRLRTIAGCTLQPSAMRGSSFAGLQEIGHHRTLPLWISAGSRIYRPRWTINYGTTSSGSKAFFLPPARNAGLSPTSMRHQYSRGERAELKWKYKNRLYRKTVLSPFWHDKRIDYHPLFSVSVLHHNSGLFCAVKT